MNIQDELQKRKDYAIQFCLDQVLDGRWTLEDCLVNYPEYQAELESLIPLSQHLRAAATIRPRPAFRRGARRRLERRLETRRHTDPISALVSAWRRRPALSLALGAAALFLVIFGASLGLIRVADAAMPGDPLYQIDLHLERVQVSLSRDSQTRSRLQLNHARERLDEASTLAQLGQPTLAQEALVAYGVQMQEIEFAAADDALLDVEMDVQEQRLDSVYAALLDEAGDDGAAEDPCATEPTVTDAAHPAIGAISSQFGVAASEVTDWYCGDYSFGEIVLALVAAEKYSVPPGPVLAFRATSPGWAALTRALQDAPPAGPALVRPTSPPADAGSADPSPGPPDGVGPPDDPGPPDGVGPPDDPGPPGDAGPPDGVGPPDDPGPPDGVGPPDDPGPPDGVGPPDGGGPPDGDERGNRGDPPGQQNRP